jgi:hypothetical protein
MHPGVILLSRRRRKAILTGLLWEPPRDRISIRRLAGRQAEGPEEGGCAPHAPPEPRLSAPCCFSDVPVMLLGCSRLPIPLSRPAPRQTAKAREDARPPLRLSAAERRGEHEASCARYTMPNVCQAESPNFKQATGTGAVASYANHLYIGLRLCLLATLR